jgi:hypothetical protein
VCPLVSRIAEVGERRSISRSVVSRGTSARCGQGSHSVAIRRGRGKKRRGVERWRQSLTLEGTPAKGAHRWKASPIGKVGGLHGSTAEAISAVPTRVLCQRGVASRLFLEKVGTSNGWRDRGARRTVQGHGRRKKSLLRTAPRIPSGGFRCRETPGSPGTAWVAQALRGRRREIDEERVLVVVSGSSGRQAASSSVVQGKSQGDLSDARASSVPTPQRR